MSITQTIKQTLSNTSFVKSFQCFKKNNILNYLITVMYDLAYYLGFAFIIFTFIRYVLPKATFLFKAKTFVEGMQNLPAEQLIPMAQQMENSIYFTGALSVVAMLLMLFSFSFFKGLVWSRIQNVTYTLKAFFSLSAANLIISLFFVGMLFIGVYLIDQSNQIKFLLWFTVPFTIYISHLANAIVGFTVNSAKETPAISGKRTVINPSKETGLRKTGFAEALSKFFKAAFARIYLFIIPYAILLIMLVVIIKFMITINFLPPKIYYLIYLLLFVSYSCWAKQYLWLVIRNLLAVSKT
ncbi:hypothetical protein HY636_05175 [Candidatus Woesearchaeota archaeon]|nr:hypothetical protein [Candidatus Woesearchaeota archaeon]